ncbi:MAG: HlyC/CorC family transporter [Burkholderiaceae bacterium]
MSDLPLWAQGLALLALLALSAFFSSSETSLMAVNRYRMRHLAAQGKRGAKMVMALLSKTDRLLATILLGNNVVNAALTALITAVAINMFGNNDEVLAVATAVAASLLIIFAEILPKVIGANRPEKVAIGASFLLAPLTVLFRPLVGAVNLLVNGLLRLLKLNDSKREEGLRPEELRAAVVESAAFIPKQHREILLNLFDLEDLTVDDVMVPRPKIEALNLEDDEIKLREQISTCFHNKLPVYDGELNQVRGILHVRKAVSMLANDEFSREALVEALMPAYFIPEGTSLFAQMQVFQANRARLALVVDEYGEVQGMVTVQDIVSELVGELSTDGAGPRQLHWDSDGTAAVDGDTLVREINRRLGLSLPVDGPRTINGLILETLQELPEANLSLKINGVPIEIQQVQDRSIRRVLMHKHVA